MSKANHFEVLILHTELFGKSDKIKSVIQQSNKFEVGKILKINPDMQESDWDELVDAIQYSKKVITI